MFINEIQHSFDLIVGVHKTARILAGFNFFFPVISNALFFFPANLESYIVAECLGNIMPGC